MDDYSRKGIRRLLKTFGIQADEAMIAYLSRHPEIESLQIRITLEDITTYGDEKPAETLQVVVEDSVERTG
ncbi:MAG TPA: hypothetical protein VLE70_01690 [Anaerolineae bacterium]|jgi:hypothetical protein|nr:hypothetical protein [Anaerolineae bacterium]